VNQPAPEEFGPPTKDPWKSLRGIMAGMLVLQGIVEVLALPVVATLGGGLDGARGAYMIVLVVLMFLGAGVQGRSWALGYNVLMQVLAIAAWWVHPAVGVAGVVFAAAWAYLFYLRRDVAQRMQRGLLPGQRDTPETGGPAGQTD